MNNLGIIGCGGHAKVVAWIAKSMHYKNLFFFDENKENYINNFHKYEFNELHDLLKNPNIDEYIVAIGDNYIRQRYLKKIMKSNLKLAKLIHPSCIISSNSKVSEGVVIMPNAIIGPKSSIGIGSIINTSSIIEHDCKIAQYCHIAPNVCVCGNVSIKDLTFVGAGSVIIPEILIGSNVTIGAGSTVIKNIENNSTVYGNPAK